MISRQFRSDRGAPGRLCRLCLIRLAFRCGSAPALPPPTGTPALPLTAPYRHPCPPAHRHLPVPLLSRPPTGAPALPLTATYRHPCSPAHLPAPLLSRPPTGAPALPLTATYRHPCSPAHLPAPLPPAACTTCRHRHTILSAALDSRRRVPCDKRQQRQYMKPQRRATHVRPVCDTTPSPSLQPRTHRT